MNERDSQSQPQSLHYLLIVGLLAGLVLGMFWFQGVRAAGEGTLIRLGGSTAAVNSFTTRITASGDRVIFGTSDTGLTTYPDTNGAGDIFLFDVESTTYTLVSRTVGGDAGNGGSGNPSISVNGSKAVFSSAATDLTADEDTNGAADIFLYDAATGAITLVSRAVGGGTANNWSYHPEISADGSKVIFTSGATDLTADADTNGYTDVFLYDVTTGTITLVSQAAGGDTGDGSSYVPEVSADGSKVVFYSYATDLTADVDTNDAPDIFLYDVATGTVTLVSRAATGGAGNGGSEFHPQISADGSKVVFSSYATDLTTDADTNGGADVFMYDVATGTLALVSQAPGGGAANNWSITPSISADSSKVVFSSDATDLTADADTNENTDAFLYDVVTGTITLISQATTGGAGNDGSYTSMISADGSKVVFSSYASDLTADVDTNGERDAFTYDVATGEIVLLSKAVGGGTGNSYSFAVQSSADGSAVSIESAATDLTTDPSSGDWAIFLYVANPTIPTGLTATANGQTHVDLSWTDNSDSEDGFKIERSSDGVTGWTQIGTVGADVTSYLDTGLTCETTAYYRVQAYNAGGSLGYSNVDGATTFACTGVTERVSVASDGTQGDGHSLTYPAISSDGRYVAFKSEASNLVSGDTNGYEDIFVHDRQTRVTERVSVASDGTQADYISYWPTISADGRYVAFFSWATNLVDGDTNDMFDVFVHDRETSTTERVSVASDGTQGNGESRDAELSADGRYVAFKSEASNLVSGDTNDADDIFVHDRQTGMTERVSVATDGTQGNGHSGWPTPSTDGRYVVFSSEASNLVGGDTNGVKDIFVHDRQTGVTERVSVDSAGNQANGTSYWPTISADGRYVAFESEASNLVSGDTNAESDIFVHDRQTGITERVSVSSAGDQGNDWSSYALLSADGRYVSFQSYASNLVNGDTNAVLDAFIHDRQTGITERISVSSEGIQGNGESGAPAMSVDSRYVAFTSESSNLVSGDTNGAYDIFVRDRNPELPIAPTNLTATANGQTQIDLSWTDNADNEDGFEIERSDDGVTGWTQIGTVGADVTTYLDTGLTCETTRYYRVRAYNTEGDSGYSNIDGDTTAACPPDPPIAPTGLSATANGQTQIDLSWTDNADNEDGFKIERSADGVTGWTQIGTVGADVTAYSDTGLTCETTRYYRVRAYNTDGDSGYSNVDGATTAACPPDPPTAPTGLTATTNGQTQIDLSWTDNADNEDGFKIEWSADGVTGWTQIGTVGADVTAYSDTGLTCETTRYYRVQAYNTGGDSGYSNVDGATTADCPASELDADTTGVFRPTNGWIYLKNQNTSGFADQFQIYGVAGDLPVAGDWDGDGIDSIGVYRDGTFYLRNDPSACEVNCFADTIIPFGMDGDLPVAGDWDADGIDEVGVYRNGTFYLVKSDEDASNLYDPFGLGIPGDLPIAGDWDGDNDDSVGVFRPDNGWIYLKFENTTGFADQFQVYGMAGDLPLAGDWDDDGFDSIGVMRGNWFYLRNDPGACEVNCFADVVFQLGIDGDLPIAGNWDGLP